MIPAYSTGSIGRAGFAIALSAVVAVAIVQSSRAPVAPAADETPAVQAGVEHNAITAFVEQDTPADEAAAREADAALARNRAQAAEDAQPAKLPAPKPAKARIVTAAVAPPIPTPAPAAAPPLQLQPPQVAQIPPAPRHKPVIARVVSTVERVPNMVGSGVRNAFHWVADLPRGAILWLPAERRFL